MTPWNLPLSNDIVSNAITRLPIFRHYDIGGALHSTSDGQKFETAVRTFNARHSPKYFGLKKGIVSYTLVANNVPVNARNISADDHESHFVFDITTTTARTFSPTFILRTHTLPIRRTSHCCTCSAISSRHAIRIFATKCRPRLPPSIIQAAMMMQS